MKAVSPRQASAMAAALAHRRGEAKSDSATIRKLAASMSEEQLADFASGTESAEERAARLTRTAARRRARKSGAFE